MAQQQRRTLETRGGSCRISWFDRAIDSAAACSQYIEAARTVRQPPEVTLAVCASCELPQSMFAMFRLSSTPQSWRAMHRNGRRDASRRSVICIGYPPSRAPRSTRNKTEACSLPAGAAWRTCFHPTRFQAVSSTALTQARNPSSCSESASTQTSGAEGRRHQKGGRARPVREYCPSCVFCRQ